MEGMRSSGDRLSPAHPFPAPRGWLWVAVTLSWLGGCQAEQWVTLTCLRGCSTAGGAAGSGPSDAAAGRDRGLQP